MIVRLVLVLGGLLAMATPSPASLSPPGAPQVKSAKAPAAKRASPRPAPADDANPGAGAQTSFNLGVWTVHASAIDANFKSGDFSTPSKVVMTRSGGDVSADRANGNYKRQVLYLNGHVVMHDSQGGAGAISGDESAGTSGPSTLTADQAQIDGAAKIYKANGNVHYVQADTVVDAQNGTLDDEAHTLLLEGAVHIVQGTRSMAARKVLYNTVTGTAHAEGDVTMQFPGEMRRHLATPRPLKIPKNRVTQPVAPTASP
ncbi:MAG: hypothetical protein JO030_04000 [Candidatus Eremiobacteraeota bacterium]|nr:hypothetical protein [Candidatus Eremiobacteraeota bacterium]